MKTLIFAALAAASLQGGSTLGPPTDAQFVAARRALNERLLDYPSARFRDVRGNSAAICGFFNAKNRMGAYSGWSRFAFVNLSEPRLYVDGEGSDHILLDGLCGEDGLQQTGRDYSGRLAGQ
ncbi:hypothetical protein D3C72_288230 [compost metagenome]